MADALLDRESLSRADIKLIMTGEPLPPPPVPSPIPAPAVDGDAAAPGDDPPAEPQDGTVDAPSAPPTDPDGPTS
jgi:hypothetical protein